MAREPCREEPTRRSTWRGALVWTAIVCVAVVARAALWRDVFTRDGVRFLADGDPYYHVLRAQRLAMHGADAAWRDPWLEHPLGAAIPWPPLFDDIVARVGTMLSAGAPVRSVNLVAAIAPLFLGVATVAIVAWMAAQLLGRTAGRGAALIAAVAPVHVVASVVGRPDHHVVEVFLACLALAGWVEAWRSPPGAARSIGGVVVSGLAISAAFWVWPGSILDVALLAAATSAAYVLVPGEVDTSRRMASALAAASAVAAVVLAVTVAEFGPPHAMGTVSLTGISAFHVFLCVTSAAFASVLAIWRRAPTLAGRVAVTVGAALATAVAVVVPSPSVRAELVRAFVAVGNVNPWYAAIGEFNPLLFSGVTPLSTELSNALAWFGATPALAVLGALELRERCRDRAAVVALVAWACVASALALARIRFGPYAAPPLAILAWLGIERGLRRLPGLARRPWGALSRALAVLATCAGLMGLYRAGMSPAGNRAAPVLAWLADRSDPVPEAHGVLAEWGLGHHVQYFARRPVVASPFGTELRGGGFADAVAFFSTADTSRAEALLDRRRVAYVLASDPWSAAGAFPTFAAAGDEPLGDVKRSWRKGLTFSPGPSYASSMANRLHRLDGGPAAAGGTSLSRMRLLRESDARDGTAEFKLYGFVPGAVLRIAKAPPRTEIAVSVQVRTNTERAFSWRALVQSEPDGTAAVRVPYATGVNGSCIAEQYVVSTTERRTFVSVSEAAVIAGTSVPASLGADERDERRIASSGERPGDRASVR